MDDLKIDLSGKLAMVTGAAGELGRAITRTLAQCGADLVIHYFKSEAKANELAAQVKAMGRKAMIISADITSEKDVMRMRDEVVAKIGSPDIIVNNAVASHPWRHVLEQDVASYESQFRSSVLHNVLMVKAFVPAMIERKWGRVIGINTECAMQCSPNQSAYVSGKRGMDGVLRTLAREIGQHNITVNQVAPGWMISDSFRSAGTERQADYEKDVPLRHRGEDVDIARAVAFLASDLARFISGVYLPVCGGNVMPTI